MAPYDAVEVQRLADGRIVILRAPNSAAFSRELLDQRDPSLLTWEDGHITIHGVEGDVTYEVTEDEGRVVYGRLRQSAHPEAVPDAANR